jgi:CheY-like chemotaxis protein
MTPLRILVVDDDELAAHALCRALESLDEAPRAVFHPRDALAISHEFDVVITDLDMPGMNGVELARTLQKRNVAVPLVFSSGMPEECALAREARTLGEWLPKPWRMTDVARLVARLRRSRTQSIA